MRPWTQLQQRLCPRKAANLAPNAQGLRRTVRVRASLARNAPQLTRISGLARYAPQLTRISGLARYAPQLTGISDGIVQIRISKSNVPVNCVPHQSCTGS